MKTSTSKLLSSFESGAMRIGAGRKQPVKVELHYFGPRPTDWGGEFRKLRLRFLAADGTVTDFELPDRQFWHFCDWASGRSIERGASLVDETRGQEYRAKLKAAYDEVKRTGKRGMGYRQAHALMKAAGGK